MSERRSSSITHLRSSLHSKRLIIRSRARLLDCSIDSWSQGSNLIGGEDARSTRRARGMEMVANQQQGGGIDVSIHPSPFDVPPHRSTSGSFSAATTTERQDAVEVRTCHVFFSASIRSFRLFCSLSRPYRPCASKFGGSLSCSALRVPIPRITNAWRGSAKQHVACWRRGRRS